MKPEKRRSRRFAGVPLFSAGNLPGPAAVGVLLVAAVTWALWPVAVVYLEVGETTVAVLALPDDAEIYLDYRHSVIREPVREVFVGRSPGGFMLVRTEHRSFGAGLPTESFGEFRHENGIYVMSGIDRPLTQIPLRVTEGSEQRLSVQGSSEIILLDFLEASNLVTIKSRRLPRAGYILWQERFSTHER
jgi:hypothetical protein